MFEVQKAIDDIYIKMGNLSKSQVDLPVVLSRLYSIINRRLAQMNLSTNSWILSYVDIYDSGEFRNPLPITDYGNAVSVEFQNQNENNIDLNWHQIEQIDIVNPVNITEARNDQRLAIGFYQNNDEGNWYYVTSFIGFEGSMRIWYEPDAPVPALIIANVAIKRLFMDMITSEAAYHAINYVKSLSADTKEAIRRSLMEDWQLWDIQFQEELEKGRERRKVIRTPFRAGM